MLPMKGRTVRTISRRVIARLLTLSVLVSISLTLALAQGKGENVERRIKFPRGHSSVTVRGFIADRLTTHEYKVRARAGQTLSVRFSSPRRDVDMCVSYPSGSAPGDGCGRKFTAVLPADGDYSIIVDSKRENTPYSITVMIH